MRLRGRSPTRSPTGSLQASAHWRAQPTALADSALFGLGRNLGVELVLLDDVNFARLLGDAGGRVRLLAALVPIRPRPQIFRFLARLVVLQGAFDDNRVVVVGVRVERAHEPRIEPEECAVS